MIENLTTTIERLPESPGIYKFYDAQATLIYVGKATNLRARVRSYFSRSKTGRLIETYLGEVVKVDWETTGSALEALIHESLLIQKEQPRYNVKQKDDKSFLGVYITKERYPRVFPARLTARRLPPGKFYGPYTSARELRAALKLIRKVFSWCDQPGLGRACFYFQLGLCPGACCGKINPLNYRKNIQRLILFLTGRRTQLINRLKREMKRLAAEKKFEQAATVRNQYQLLNKIHDTATLIHELDRANLWPLAHQPRGVRVEGYDISNVTGQWAVGSMVTFLNQQPLKAWYRKFRIRSVDQANDLAMMVEVINRRLKHSDWPWPEVVIVDGGQAHFQAVKKVLTSHRSPAKLLAIAKGPDRKKSDLYFNRSDQWLNDFISHQRSLITRVRDEAHRVAIGYYRRLHRRSALTDQGDV